LGGSSRSTTSFSRLIITAALPHPRQGMGARADTQPHHEPPHQTNVKQDPTKDGWWYEAGEDNGIAKM
jgi:hypothetical protein